MIEWLDIPHRHYTASVRTEFEATRENSACEWAVRAYFCPWRNWDCFRFIWVEPRWPISQVLRCQEDGISWAWFQQLCSKCSQATQWVHKQVFIVQMRSKLNAYPFDLAVEDSPDDWKINSLNWMLTWTPRGDILKIVWWTFTSSMFVEVFQFVL